MNSIVRLDVDAVALQIDEAAKDVDCPKIAPRRYVAARSRCGEEPKRCAATGGA
jgi:hypothetical protein